MCRGSRCGRGRSVGAGCLPRRGRRPSCSRGCASGHRARARARGRWRPARTRGRHPTSSSWRPQNDRPLSVTTDEWLEVRHTEGLGVVLRTAPASTDGSCCCPRARASSAPVPPCNRPAAPGCRSSRRPEVRLGGRGLRRPRALAAEDRLRQIAVQQRDEIDADALRADRLALAVVAAVPKPLGVVPRDHVSRTRRQRSACPCGSRPRCPTFADMNSIADAFGTGRHAGAAPDTGRRVERPVRRDFGDRRRVRVRRAPRVGRDKAARLNDRGRRPPIDDRSLSTGNAAARHGSRVSMSPSLKNRMCSWQTVVARFGPCATPLIMKPQVPQMPSRQSLSKAIGSSPGGSDPR